MTPDPIPVSDLRAEAEAVLTLALLPGLKLAQARSLLQYYGSGVAALADPHPPIPLWKELLAQQNKLCEARDRARRECDFCEEHQIRMIPFTSPDYPRLLKEDEVNDPPLQLFYCGTGSLDRPHVLSVVGTRRITEYGKGLCERLIADLSALVPDLFVVSGLAYGVDIHAHRAALAAGVDTVAVLAHGLDRIYPSLHRRTALEMVRHGGLLTEYISGTVPDKGNFVRRNRIVAGIAPATLVVESAEKGGALITAGIASSYGREVMAVPGRTTDVYSAGCNRLIIENKASLVTSAEDIANLLNWKTDKKAAAAPQPSLFPSYTPVQERILDALSQSDECSLDRLALLTQIPLAELTDHLFDLEDLRAVKQLPGNRYRLVR